MTCCAKTIEMGDLVNLQKLKVRLDRLEDLAEKKVIKKTEQMSRTLERMDKFFRMEGIGPCGNAKPDEHDTSTTLP